jgi:hypothetical protein
MEWWARRHRATTRHDHAEDRDMDQTSPTQHTARRWRRVVGTAAVGMALVAGTAACGGSDQDAADQAADELAEQLAESGSGGEADVDIDSESGQVDVQTEDGDMSFGEGTELPDDFPSDIPLPADYELTSAMSTSTSGSEGWTIGGNLPNADGATFDDLVAEFTSAGWTEMSKTTSETEGGTASTAMFDNGTWQVLFSTQIGIEGLPDSFSYVVTAAA